MFLIENVYHFDYVWISQSGDKTKILAGPILIRSDESDGIKISGFLKVAAAVKATKGFMPAEIYKTLRS